MAGGAWNLAERFVGHTIWFDSLWILLPAIVAPAPAVKIAAELRKKRQEMRKIRQRQKKEGAPSPAEKDV